MNKTKTHPRYHPAQVVLRHTVCTITLHMITSVEFQEGDGSDYREVLRCTCGKRKIHGYWTDDNQQQGFGNAKKNRN